MGKLRDNSWGEAIKLMLFQKFDITGWHFLSKWPQKSSNLADKTSDSCALLDRWKNRLIAFTLALL